MLRHISIAIVSFMLAVSISKADTVIPGGYVSGTWTAVGSPYLIEGDITIHPDSNLTIEPAVEVEFQGYYSLTVNGYLDAVGTEADSIHFTPLTTWAGLRFTNAPDSSHICYCHISSITCGFFGAIDCNNSNPVISHCKISGGSGGAGAIRVQNNSSPYISYCTILSFDGCGIQWQSLAPGTISHCTISSCTNSGIYRQASGNLTLLDCIIADNTVTTYPGGGIRSTVGGGLLSLLGCTISGNCALNNGGGGIWCQYGTLALTDCALNDNYAADIGSAPNIGGGGLCLYNANASLSYCTIFDNFGAPYGGGVAISNSGNLSVDHCTIENNENDSDYGSGVYISGGCTSSVTNSIISNNFPDYGIYNSGSLTVDYTDFYNNSPGSVGGGVPAGFGELITVNTNGDSCDAYSNLFLDPLFVDYTGGDYNLTEESPCIDAGDPAYAYDPDSTITDLGCYYFYQYSYPEFAVTLTYVSGSPVPPGGGLLTFDVYLSNNSGVAQDFDAWVDIEYEGGAPSTVVQRSFTNYQPGWAVNRPDTWFPIPAGYAAGNYEMFGRCGIHPDEIWAEDGFPFVKSGTSEGSVFVPFLPEGVPDIFGDIDRGDTPVIPTRFTFLEAHPNPFNPVTSMSFALPEVGNVRLTVFNVQGRKVAELVDGTREAGIHEVTFDATDLPSGVYFARLAYAGQSQVQKLMLIK